LQGQYLWAKEGAGAPSGDFAASRFNPSTTSGMERACTSSRRTFRSHRNAAISKS
jgi:hypothetical protein